MLKFAPYWIDNVFNPLTYKALETNFVTKEENLGIFTLELQESDYLPLVNKKTEDYRRKATINGFRQGKAPLPLVKKMLGTSVYVEEIDKLINGAVKDFIKAQPEKYLLNNNPVLIQENSRMDFLKKEGVRYEFAFALRPKIEIDNKLFLQVKDYEPVINPAIVEAQYEQNLVLAYPNAASEEAINAQSLIRVKISITEPYTHKVGLSMYIPHYSEALQAPFIGKNKDEEVEVDLKSYFGEGEFLEYKLRLPRGNYEQGSPTKGVLSITEILTVTVPESDKDILMENYGEGVSTKEAAIEKITKESIRYIKQDIDFVVAEDLYEVMKENVKVDISDEYTRLHLRQVSEVSEANMAEEAIRFKRGVVEGLLKSAVAEGLDVVLDENAYQIHLTKMLAVNMGFPTDFISEANYAQFLPYLTQHFSSKDPEHMEIIAYRARLESMNQSVLAKLRTEGMLGATLPYSWEARNQIFVERTKRNKAAQDELDAVHVHGEHCNH